MREEEKNTHRMSDAMLRRSEEERLKVSQVAVMNGQRNVREQLLIWWEPDQRLVAHKPGADAPGRCLTTVSTHAIGRLLRFKERKINEREEVREDHPVGPLPGLYFTFGAQPCR